MWFLLFGQNLPDCFDYYSNKRFPMKMKVEVTHEGDKIYSWD